MKILSQMMLLMLFGSMAFAQTRPTPTPTPTPVPLAPVQSVEEFNQRLPYWGTSWSPGSFSENGYYPSFYTGFAMRSQFPERIHLRLSRGNSTRVTVNLDEQTILDYLFDLKARLQFFQKFTSGPKPVLNLKPSGANLTPQFTYYTQVLTSPRYGIMEFVDRAEKGLETKESIYNQSLTILQALNPGRVFMVRIDLRKEFLNWKSAMQNALAGDIKKVTANPGAVITTLNTMVWGRVNAIEKPSAELMTQLTTTLQLIVDNAPEEDFIPQALRLFKLATGSKYDFLVLNSVGQFQKAIQCTPSRCELTSPEFTAIYPTGSVMESTSDEFGNRINSFATPGLWQFLSRPGKHEVDNIRNEPYYGFAPKMDYEEAGNGYHNPAVRFWDPSKALKLGLGIDLKHDTFWAVKRGPVSHGCSRIPIGHLWEMRQIFPVENSKATKVFYFGSFPQDFDVFDVDGSGQLKVMGVEYLISYGLQGTDGLARREGTNLEINAGNKLAFYTTLYGARNVFEYTADGQYQFANPRVSMPSYLDFKRHSVSSRLKLTGVFPLYEQAYERDKVQLYAVGPMSNPQNKLIARLMGRVRGCAPFSNKDTCGEAAFRSESMGLLR